MTCWTLELKRALLPRPDLHQKREIDTPSAAWLPVPAWETVPEIPVLLLPELVRLALFTTFALFQPWPVVAFKVRLLDEFC